ncbi:hypothetical protein DPEC_G00123910 [Dallia pectoralis]|uniref:Uncharacterized protein n=1 Tax=Dallia pectoralis TaxID=75939 RepID=A0ACC2GQP5_DALPE|nr:hypothetical protein DPEC_G00123910 [Dallia pectoralis]
MTGRYRISGYDRARATCIERNERGLGFVAKIDNTTPSHLVPARGEKLKVVHELRWRIGLEAEEKLVRCPSETGFRAGDGNCWMVMGTLLNWGNRRAFTDLLVRGSRSHPCASFAADRLTAEATASFAPRASLASDVKPSQSLGRMCQDVP